MPNALTVYEGLLLRGTRRFYHNYGLKNHSLFLYSYARRDGQAELAWAAWLNMKTKTLQYLRTVTHRRSH